MNLKQGLINFAIMVLFAIIGITFCQIFSPNNIILAGIVGALFPIIGYIIYSLYCLNK